MGQDNGNDKAADQVEKKSSTRFTLTGYLWLCSMAALGSWVAVMAADSGPVTEYVGPPVIVPDPVEDGGRVTVELSVKRHRFCPGTVSRLLRDADTKRVLAIYDPVPAAYPPRLGITSDRIPKTFELPEHLPPRVTYESDVCFVCNPLQHWFPICTRVPSVTFGVIPRRF